MGSFWNFVFGLILIIIWILSGGYVTQANILLTSYNQKDDDLHSAYWHTFWAAFTTWTLVGLFIIFVILGIVGIVALFSTGIGEAASVESISVAQQAGSTITTTVSTGASWLTIL